MTVNLEADLGEQAKALDEMRWTALQADVCMNVANAKRDAFICEAQRLAELVRLGVVSRETAAACLDTAARYNQLYFEYGADHIQAIMSAANGNEAAA
jgi:multidrug resistance efflux pump